MNLNINQQVGISAQWNIEVCTPTESGEISTFPFGTGFKNNAILNYFLSGIIRHVSEERDPKIFYPAYFADGFIQLGTGIKPIAYTDSSLDKFYQETNYIRPLSNRINVDYITGSGLAIFEKTYDFPTSPGTIKYTEAGFRHVDSAGNWSSFRINPIYSRFLFTEDCQVTGYISGILSESGFYTLNHPLDKVSGVFAIITNNSGEQTIRQYEISPKIIVRQNVTGFLSGYLSYLNVFTPFSGQNMSGYFLSGQKYFFPPYSTSTTENIVGYLSGNMTELSGFIPYSNSEASSGYFLSGNQYRFTGEFNEFSGLPGFENGYFYNGFSIISFGFVPDIENEIYGAGKLTGVIGNRNIYTTSNNSFSGFSGSLGFDNRVGFGFSRFFMSGSGLGSGFVQNSGQPTFGQLKFGTGQMTGIIGHRNIFLDNTYSGLSGIPTHEYGWYFIQSGMFGSSGLRSSNDNYSGIYPFMTGFSGLNSGSTTGIGILTGIIGYKKYISPITLNAGQYIKMKYRIAFRIPQYSQSSLVTGSNVVYGDFNASGQVKLLGLKERIFGSFEEDEMRTTNGTAIFYTDHGCGAWWSATGPYDPNSYPYPTIGLSAVMLRSGESIQGKPDFPEIDTRPRFLTVTGIPEENLGNSYKKKMTDPHNQYPLKNQNTLTSKASGYEIENTFIFKGEFPDFDVDIGGIWFSYVDFNLANRRNAIYEYIKPDSGDFCGWMYKFNTPQRKWEDQALYVTTKFVLDRDQLFEDPYYGRYPQ